MRVGNLHIRYGDQIIDALDGAAILAFTDRRGIITGVNDNFCKISGYNRDELVGRTHSVINSGHHPREFFTKMWQTIARGETWSGDIKNKRKDDSYYWVRTVITGLRHSETGALEGYLATRFDITAQKASEEQLSEAQQLAKMGSFQLDIATGVLICSSHFYKVLEVAPSQSSENLKNQFAQRLHPNDAEVVQMAVDQAISSGDEFTMDFRLCFEDGTRVKHIRCIAKVERDTHQTPQVMKGTIQDISEVALLREQNQFILEALGVGIWQWNPISKKMTWDPSMHELFEIPAQPEQDHLETWQNALTKESRQRAIDELHAGLLSDHSSTHTLQILTGKGQNKYIGSRSVVIRNRERLPVMLYGISWDKTKEVLLNTQLDTLLSNAPVMVFRCQLNVKTMDFSMPYFSDRATAIFELSQNELRSDSSVFLKMLHPEDTASAHHALQKSARHLSPLVWSGRILTGQQTMKWVRTHCMPTRLTADIVAWDGVLIDVTEEHNLREAMERERLKSMHAAKMASIGTMAASVAHELNNPLAIVSGACTALERQDALSSKALDHLMMIKRSVSRMAKIVSTLKKYSRYSDRKPFQPTSISSIVYECLNLTEAKSKRHATPVSMQLHSDGVIDCDPIEIEQVLVNLIGNAIDAVKELVERWVEIAIYEELEHLVLLVRDSGSGIPATVQKQLFDPFYTTKPEGEGTGLGLAISKEILDAHHATIRLVREDPHTCFEIRFLKSKETQHVA